ncbi:MAG: flagellar hook-basal body complex protein FliE [Aquificaceae bacterium]|jgi:flagellar hook-basal body complex protein FliE|uniref:Flagellar hook-basal body complex protein FliE n=1 Tax=Hydrogenobacter sp. TaxID=2152829 RepID=A0A7C2V2X8_9AQUI|nr:flagellar hook-basal body complex protein FliE [Aquificaceae bacterium]
MEIREIDGLLRERLETKKGEGGDFLKELGKFVNWVNQEQQKAEAIKDAVLKGADIPLHQMVIEFEKASVALNLLIQVRNKLLEAYQELNRMQV